MSETRTPMMNKEDIERAIEVCHLIEDGNAVDGDDPDLVLELIGWTLQLAKEFDALHNECDCYMCDQCVARLEKYKIPRDGE